MSKKPAIQAQTSSDILDLNSIIDTILDETETPQYELSPIEEAWVRKLKCYNVMKPTKPVESLEWNIIYSPSSNEEVYWSEIEWSIIAVRKYWDWFVKTKHNTDEWKVIQEFYSTNQMWIFETEGIKFKWFCWDNETRSYSKTPIWVWNTKEFQNMINDEQWIYFKEWKTTVDWSEKYPESNISKKIVVYIKTDKWIFALNPWASYWKYNNVKEWTLEAVKQDCAKELKILWKDFKKASLDLCKVKWKVIKDWNYYIIKWIFDWFVDNSIAEDRWAIKSLIDENNSFEFKDLVLSQLSLSDWMWTIFEEAPKLPEPYSFN